MILSFFTMVSLLYTLFVLISTVRLELRSRSPFVAFPIALLLIYFVPFVGFFSINDSYSPQTYLASSVWGALFLTFFFCFRWVSISFIFGGKLSSLHALKVKDLSNGGLYVSLVFFVIGCTCYLYLISFDLSNFLQVSFGEVRSLPKIPYLIMIYSFYLSSGIVLFLFLKKYYSLVFLVIFIILAISVSMKSRGYLVSFLMPLAIFYFINEGLDWKKLVKFGALASVFLFFYILVRAVRHAGTLLSIGKGKGNVVADAGEFSLIDGYFYFVENFRFHEMISGFGENVSLLKLVSLPFGGALQSFGFPERPSDRLIWDAYTGIEGVDGSFHPTAIGAAFFDSPFYGYLIYPLFLNIIFGFYQALAVSSRSLYVGYFSVAVLFSFFIARGSFHNGFLVVFSSIFIFGAANIMLRIKTKTLFGEIRDGG